LWGPEQGKKCIRIKDWNYIDYKKGRRERKVQEGTSSRIRTHTCTFTRAAEVTLEASNARFSTARKSLSPSAFARTLTPLSFVDTAIKVPSLLKRTQGEA